MNQQRLVIYEARRRILAGEDLNRHVHSMLIDVITAYVEGATAGRARAWNLEGLWTALKTVYPVGIDPHVALPTGARRGAGARQHLLNQLIQDSENALARRESDVDSAAGVGAMRQMEREIILGVIDRKWREHLYEMDYLKGGIGLRALAQRDPLVEFHQEGHRLFVRMLEAVKEECVGALFHATNRPGFDSPTPPESEANPDRLHTIILPNPG